MMNEKERNVDEGIHTLSSDFDQIDTTPLAVIEPIHLSYMIINLYHIHVQQ